MKLHDDLIRERESARIARKELRNEILDTKKLKEAQLEENEGTSRIIDQLNTELNGIKEKNREKNMVSTMLLTTTTAARNEAAPRYHRVRGLYFLFLQQL